MRAALLTVVLAALALAAPVAALGGSASVVRGTVSYQAGPGEENAVTILRTPDAVRIVDAGAPIAAGAGCESVSANEVACAAARVRAFDVALGDLDDSLSVSSGTPVAARGGPGDDVLAGGEGDDRLAGGPGDDVLRGGIGEDLFVGGPGADVFGGGSGSQDELGLEEIEFGAGIGVEGCDIELRGELALDVVLYVGRSARVRVTLDGRPDDGEAGEGDNVLPDVEWVVGGRGDDLLVGNERQNFLVGASGDDILGGGGGPDLLLGSRGDDRVVGGAGRDCAAGGAGADLVRGGAASDLVVGGAGADTLLGGAGGDFLVARDATRDLVDGGAGFDFGFVDRRRDVVRRVERFVDPTREHEPPAGIPLAGRGE